MAGVRPYVWRVAALVFACVSVAATACSAQQQRSRPALTFTQFASPRSNDSSVWVASADGSHARKVVAHAYGGSLSADGRWLTFERTSGARFSLFVVDLTTGKTRPLGKSTGDEGWAPHGATLAVSQPGGFFLIDAAAGTRRRLLAAHVDSFDFTPDGGSIVLAKTSGLVGYPSERSDLFQLRLSDNTLTRLTRDGHSKGPLVSREGVVYVRFDNNPYPRYETWQMRRDGSNQRLLARCCESSSDTRANSAYGFTAVGLSADGARLLACMPWEFGCVPIAIDLPEGRQRSFRALRNGGTSQEASWTLDLSRDGRSVLILIRPVNDGPGPWLLYSVPFEGGKPALLARNVSDGGWRR